jgi:hypothetical protein
VITVVTDAGRTKFPTGVATKEDDKGGLTVLDATETAIGRFPPGRWRQFTDGTEEPPVPLVG